MRRPFRIPPLIACARVVGKRIAWASIAFASVGFGGVACSPQRRSTAESTSAVSTSAGASAPSSLAGPAGSDVPRQAGVYYTFRTDDALSALSATVCFRGSVPKMLLPPTGGAIPLLSSARIGNADAIVSEGKILLPNLHSGECVTYSVNIGNALDGSNMRDGAGRLGSDALLSPDWWLWYPSSADAEEPNDALRPTIRARFVSSGPQPAMPWPESQLGLYTHLIEPSTFVWKAQGAFSKRTAHPIELGTTERNSKVNVLVLGDGFGPRQAAVFSWIKRSGDAVANLFGSFPLASAQVLLVPNGGSFGFVLRGGGPVATLLMSPRPSDTDLDASWTAVHELLHFSHPPMGAAESWFYEGLATYLTAVARARSGMTTKKYGWWELLDGFERGSKVGTGQTLREECKAMRKNHTYWRVYWSGAAMFLTIDVALRRKGKSLEALIAKLAAQNLDDSHPWTAEELIGKLDQLCNCSVPSSVTKKHLDARAFPMPTKVIRALGVSLAPQQSVTYTASAADAEIRRAIMGGD